MRQLLQEKPMPVKDARKPRICKCGETNPNKFYATQASECKKCQSNRSSARQRGNHELHRARHLKRAYGWTPERYDAELAKQHGLCAMCGKPPDDTDLQKILMVDHNHETGEVRGLIHGRCNAIIGYAKEDTALLLSAIDYVIRYRKKA